MNTPHNCPWCRASITDKKTKAGQPLPKYYGVQYECGAIIRQINNQVVTIHGCGEFKNE